MTRLNASFLFFSKHSWYLNYMLFCYTCYIVRLLQILNFALTISFVLVPYALQGFMFGILAGIFAYRADSREKVEVMICPCL